LQRFKPEQIIPLSGLQTGQKIDVAVLNAALERLRNIGFFINVGYRYNYVDEQLDVIFTAEEAKWNLPVVFDNFIWFTDEEIISAVRQEVPTFEGFAPRSGGVIKLITAALERLLREKKITGQIDYVPAYERSGADQEHIFSVKGANLKICALNFPGARFVPESELLKTAKPLINADYSRSFVAEFVKGNLVPVYRERGHLRVKFALSQARPGTSADCPNGVGVTLAVEEGAAYLWDKPEWSGNAALAAQELDSLLAMKADEIANGLKLDKSVKSLVVAYGKRGFITMRLTLTPNFDDASRRVSYRIEINEGGQYRMGDVTINGLPGNDVERLEKRWKLPAGETYNASYIEEFMRTVIPDNRFGKAMLTGVSVTPDRANLTAEVTFNFR
jgi:outer membrane protein assembly factor BamA